MYLRLLLLCLLVSCQTACEADPEPNPAPAFDLTGRWRFEWFADGQKRVSSAILEDHGSDVDITWCKSTPRTPERWRDESGSLIPEDDYREEATIVSADFLDNDGGDDGWVACRVDATPRFDAGSLTVAGNTAGSLCAQRDGWEVVVAGLVGEEVVRMTVEGLETSLAAPIDTYTLLAPGLSDGPALRLHHPGLGLPGDAGQGVGAESGEITFTENSEARLKGSFTASFPEAGTISGSFDVTFDVPKCAER